MKNHSFSLDIVDENQLSELEKAYKPPKPKTDDEIELERLEKVHQQMEQVYISQLQK